MPDEPIQTKSKTNSRLNFNKLKHRLNKKSLTYFICAAISIASIIVIIIVIAISLYREEITDGYFISDDTKTVIPLGPNSSSGQNNSSAKTFVVFTHKDDTISGLKTYFDYATPEAAQSAFDSVKNNPEFTNAEVNGKYIIVTSNPDQYKGLTVSDIKQQADAIEQMQKTNKADQDQSKNQNENQPEEYFEEP